MLEKVAQRHVPLVVRVHHSNRWRAQWYLNRRKGRPGQTALNRPVCAGAALVQVTPHLSFVGGHLCAHWLDHQERFPPVGARLQPASAAYKPTAPEDDFARLHHREQTLLRRLQALFFAPLLGIETLTGFDTHEHPLPTLLGRGYHRSTLRQVLGQLERLNAAEALSPALVPDTVRHMTYVDGHMIAYWSRRSMHKGKITMLGRIMAGSPAVIAHNEAGQALVVAYFPPDLHLSQVIVAYGQRVAMATRSTLFVLDRAVNTVVLARAFDAQGLGLLCMLDDNEHDGLDSFEPTEVRTLEDGVKVSSGDGQVPRPDDPRHVVSVEPAVGKPLVYWGTPQVKAAVAALEWPRLYRERNEIQENGFKRLIDHGALHTNYGRKTIVSPDRHQQHAREQLDQSLGAVLQRVSKQAEAVQAQQTKVAESASKGHSQRLEQRQRALAGLEQELQAGQHPQAKLAAQATALVPPRVRADRDFRKQTIMTIRTLLLENALTSFMAVLLGLLTMKMSLDGLLQILFERCGARVVTDSQVIYWVNTAGLSGP